MKALFKAFAKVLVFFEPNAWEDLFIINMIVNAVEKIFVK